MRKKILVAEDERDICFMLEQLLSLEGYEVRIAADGKQTLEKLAREDFDLLILDLMMPVVDGFGVLKEMDPSKLGRMKVVVLSAQGTEADKVRGYSVGVSEYVTKPFDNSYLLDIVKYLIGEISPQERETLEERLAGRRRE